MNARAARRRAQRAACSAIDPLHAVMAGWAEDQAAVDVVRQQVADQMTHLLGDTIAGTVHFKVYDGAEATKALRILRAGKGEPHATYYRQLGDALEHGGFLVVGHVPVTGRS